MAEEVSVPGASWLQLAQAHGVATEYWDWRGQQHQVSESTLRAVLAALGVDATTPAGAEAAVRDHEEGPWRRALPPVVVAQHGQSTQVAVHVCHGSAAQVVVEFEGGGRRELRQADRWVPPRLIDGRQVGEASFELPPDLPLGWHTLRLVTASAPESSCPLICTPDRLELPARLARERSWGVMAQLYAARSARSWGIGDLEDLAELALWAGADLGADFVLVNPLHAAEPAGPMEPSPYLPTTRRFVNPLYLRIEAVPEVAGLSKKGQDRVRRLANEAQAANLRDELNRDAAWQAKQAALELVYAVPRTPGRSLEFAAFRREAGPGLTDFATWCALAEEHGTAWRSWPEDLTDPRSAAVTQARQRLSQRVDFYCWLQWIADEQLASAQRRARAAGMGTGVVHDLAVGVHPDGADTWALGSALARGVNVGAPPDAFNQLGQDWSQPPWRPDQLAELGYAPYRDLLRTVLRSAGGIRVDHIMGLFRLWWVPEGESPTEGTYVRYDHEAMVGILALEAQRAGAVVIGEDLGVVEPWVRDYLNERGILGTSVLWFERDHAGGLLPPESWRELCLATVTTHDLPPTAGYLEGVHVDLRDRLGLLTRPVAEERAVDEADRAAVLTALTARGLLGPAPTSAEIVTALHRFVTWTPARMIGVSLSDLVGDRRIINQPGTDEEYPNWRVPLADGQGRLVLLDELPGLARAAEVARAAHPG